jgi:hypothetical protein
MLFWTLIGCPSLSSTAYLDRVQDVDGDGAIATRFDGPDCRDDDPTIVTCDADGDGRAPPQVGGDDCDDTNATVYPGAAEVCDGVDNDCDGAVDNADADVVAGEVPYFVDADGDGTGDRMVACQVDGRHVVDGGDCDDADPTVGPDAEELCDGIDNDCDGTVDEDGLLFRDGDGDGYGEDGFQARGDCAAPLGSGVARVGGDCDDADAAISPGATEIPYDGVDSRCNGSDDEWDLDGDGAVPAASFAAAVADQPGAGFTSGDCDDGDDRAYPAADEICDGIDNDCDGAVDSEDLVGGAVEPFLSVGTWYRDGDGDGFGGTAVQLCPNEVTTESLTPDDCDDGDPSVSPDATETCDGADDDCDGRIDFALDAFPGAVPLFLDQDGDGVGVDPVFGCAVDVAQGIAALGGDCNDAAPGIYPGAPEICGDAFRQDCSTASLFDCDGDGHEGTYVGGGTGADCDDIRAAVNPDVTVELCDGLDNDCDGLLDSADVDDLDAGPLPLWFTDGDGDGFGVDDGNAVQSCEPPPDRALTDDDCDDADPTRSPATRWTFDGDGDGYGNPATAQIQCVSPGPGYVVAADDCDDADATLNPDTTWSVDADGDGFGAGPVVTACVAPSGRVRAMPVDCDDSDDTRSPGATEIPDDGVDNDCDGVVDAPDGVLWYVDADGDGFGDPTQPGSPVYAPDRVPNDRDCNDANAAQNPAVFVEFCDGVDNNCDGLFIAGDPDVSNPFTGVVIPDDRAVRLFVEVDGEYSLDRVLSVCEPTGARILDGPEGASWTLLAATDPGFDLSLIDACPDSTPGVVWVGDADSDGFPDGFGADLELVCDGSTRSGKVAWDPVTTRVDCAPFDPDRWLETDAANLYGDRDGDGHVGFVSLPPGTCVGMPSPVPGIDCDDTDSSEQDHARNPVTVVEPDELAAALRACHTADLMLPAAAYPLSLIDLAAPPPDARIRLFGGPDTKLELADAASVAFDLALQGLLLEGPNTELSVNIDGKLQLTDVVVSGMPLGVFGGQVTMDRVIAEWSVSDALWLEVMDGTVTANGLTVQGGNGARGIEVREDGFLIGTDLTLQTLQRGLDVWGSMATEETDVLLRVATFTDVDWPMTAHTGGDVVLEDVTVEGTGMGVGFDITTGGSLVCDRCDLERDLFETISVATDASLVLRDSSVSHNNDLPCISVQGEALVERTLLTGQGIVTNDGGTTELEDVVVDGADLGLVVAVGGMLRGEGVAVQNVGVGVSVLGAAELEDVIVSAAGSAVTVDGTLLLRDGELSGAFPPAATGVVQVEGGGSLLLEDVDVQLGSPPDAPDTVMGALVVDAGGSAELRDVWLRGAVGGVGDEEGFGRGLHAAIGSVVTGERIHAEDAHVGFDLESSAVLHDVSVELPAAGSATGVFIQTGSPSLYGVEVTSALSNPSTVGIDVHETPDVVLTDLDLVVVGGLPLKASGTLLDIDGAFIRSTGVPGVEVDEGGYVVLRDARVLTDDGPAVRVRDTSGGDPATLYLEGSLVMAGVLGPAMAVENGSQATLERVTVVADGDGAPAFQLDDDTSLVLRQVAAGNTIPAGATGPLLDCTSIAVFSAVDTLSEFEASNICGIDGDLPGVTALPSFDLNADLQLLLPERLLYGERALP